MIDDASVFNWALVISQLESLKHVWMQDAHHYQRNKRGFGGLHAAILPAALDHRGILLGGGGDERLG